VKIGLLLFLPEAVAKSSGLAYANVLWVYQQVQQVGFGVILMLMGHVSFREITRNLSREQEAAASPGPDTSTAAG
jgi:hypothetical protein